MKQAYYGFEWRRQLSQIIQQISSTIFVIILGGELGKLNWQREAGRHIDKAFSVIVVFPIAEIFIDIVSITPRRLYVEGDWFRKCNRS